MLRFDLIYDEAWLLSNWPWLYGITSRLEFEHNWFLLDTTPRLLSLLWQLWTSKNLWADLFSFPMQKCGLKSKKFCWVRDGSNSDELCLDGGYSRNLLCSKSSLKVIPYNQGQFESNQALSYIKSNLSIWTTRRPKGFRIHPHTAEKRGT